MSKPIPLEPGKTHVFRGTPNMLTTHSTCLIYKHSIISIKGQNATITEIKHGTKSSIYKNNHFYELKFKLP